MFRKSGVLLVALAIAISACTSPATPAGSSASAAPSASAQALAGDQNLRFVIGEPTSMDPDIAADASIWYVDQVFEGLYKILDDGKVRFFGATDMSISPDGLTWTWKLNPKAKWSDGTPVTASDYEYSWKRAIDPKLASDSATFFTAIKGAADYIAGKSKDPNTVAVKAVDNLTLQAVLTEPAPYFKAIVGLTYLYPVPKATVEKFGNKWTEAANIVTNGPWKVSSWKHDQELVFVRDENYWGAKPTLTKISMRIAAGADLAVTSLRAFEAGETDFAISVPATDLQRVLNDPVLGKQLTPEILSASNFLVFDTTHPPFDKTKVRQAFNLATDRDKIVQTLSKGLQKAAKVLVPPGIQGYQPAHALPGAVADGKKALTDGGFADPKSFPQVTLTVPTSQKTLAELLQQMWSENLGVNVKVDVMESKAFSAWRTARSNQSFDIYTRGGWYSDYEDPTNWYNTFFVDGWLNSHWNNTEFLDLVKKAAPEQDNAKRQQIYEQADVIMERESPTMGLYYFADYWMRKPYLQGVQHVRIDGFIWLRDAQILAH